MASPQKTKGKSYENAKAKFLTEIFSEKFIRVPTSGAFLGGKNYDLRAGCFFRVPPRIVHQFSTSDQPLCILNFHSHPVFPDKDTYFCK